MVQPLTLATAAAPPPPPVLPPALPTDPAAQLDAFWRQTADDTAAYLEHGHGLPRRQAMETARTVAAAVRETTDLPDREVALARCLHEAAIFAEARSGVAPRPHPLPVAGLPMDPQPLAPVLIAPSPVAGAARLWAMAAAAMVVPALAAFAALVLV